MKVAINVTSLENAHKNRGVGYYTRNLIDSLENHTDIQIVKFRNINEVSNVDLIHYPWFDFYFRNLPLISKYPIVVTIHDVMPLIFKDKYPVGIRGKINFQWQMLALKRVKKIITDSYVSKQDIQKYLFQDKSKIEVVHLAADKKFRVLPSSESLRVKLKYRLPERFLLYVGDANYVKNLPFLITGFKKLREIPELQELKLVLVGGVFLKKTEGIDHPELASLKETLKLINEYDLTDYIIKPGQIDDDDLVGIYNLATVYVQPSLYEGFGLPVVQALACGTAVASSDAGSLKEIGGDAVIYFNPTNLDQMVTILKVILTDKNLNKKLSVMALEQSGKFAWKKVAYEIRKIYEAAF